MNNTDKNLIVFDIDGTLCDSVKPHQEAFIESLYALGVKQIDPNFKTFKHHSDSFIAKTIFEKETGEAFTHSLLIEFESILYGKIQKQPIPEIPGARKALEYLFHHPNFAVSFATGSLQKPAEYKLECLNIVYHPMQLVSSNHLHERESIVQTAIDNAKSFYQEESFNRIISIGDGVWDLITAQNLGLEFVGIGTLNKDVLQTNGSLIHHDDFNAFSILSL